MRDGRATAPSAATGAATTTTDTAEMLKRLGLLICENRYLRAEQHMKIILKASSLSAFGFSQSDTIATHRCPEAR
jgi:hypothetical protein